MLSMLVIASALAANGELVVEVQGSSPLVVHIDGKRRGDASEGKPVKADLAVGRHEVAVSYDQGGVWLFCVGEVMVPGGGVKVEAGTRSCTNLESAARTSDTVRKGGLVQITGADATGVVNLATAGEIQLVGRSTVIGNVAAGTHTITVGKACSGAVTVADRKSVV